MTLNSDSKLAAEALKDRCVTGYGENCEHYWPTVPAGSCEPHNLADALESGAKVILPKEAQAIIEAVRDAHLDGCSALHEVPFPCDCALPGLLAAYDEVVANVR